MTTVELFSREPGELGLRVQGHSGSAPAGKDLVCAAASILAWTLAEAAGEEPRYHTSVTVEQDGAMIEVSCFPEDKAKESCLVMIGTIWTGFQMLAEREPEYIKIRSDNDAE